jgi:hypothetical protein
MKSRGAKRIGATPQHEYRIPIAKSLLEMKGAGETNKVLDAVYVKMKNKLMPVDLELKDKTGEARWRLQARWERKNMALDGLLKADSPYGVWELTPKGAALVS